VNGVQEKDIFILAFRQAFFNYNGKTLNLKKKSTVAQSQPNSTPPIEQKIKQNAIYCNYIL
jgi:hypothetical protein